MYTGNIIFNISERMLEIFFIIFFSFVYYCFSLNVIISNIFICRL